MKTQGEDGHLYTEERGLRGNQPCSHLDLGLPVSRIRFLLFKLPNVWFFVMADLER